MKKQEAETNPYKSFNQFMIRQGTSLYSPHKIDDADQNELRGLSRVACGRSADIEFYDSEAEDFHTGAKQFVFSEKRPSFRAVPLKVLMSSDKGANAERLEKRRSGKEKRSADDSPDREGFSEKRDGRRKKVKHDGDGLESAEEKDPVLVVSGRAKGSESWLKGSRRSDFSARRSG